MFKKLLIVLTVALCGCYTAFAQQVKVTGTVTDITGVPVIGAFIQVTGGTTGTMTDENGAYTIDVASDGSLTFSMIGYQTQVVDVNGRAVINAVLAEDSELLDEVIVVAFAVDSIPNVLTSTITS